MNIGVCVNHDKTVSERLRCASELGFRHCQLISWNPLLWNDNEALHIKEELKKFHITVTAFWCGWEGPKAWNFYEGHKTLGLLPAEFRELRVKNLKDGADFALTLGVTDVVSHMGFIPENPFDPNYGAMISALKSIADHLKQNGQNLLFETGQETPVTLLRAFEDIGTDNLGVNLDPANFILYGKANPVDSLDIIGKLVKGVHAKDGFYPVNGHDLGKEVKIGKGKVDFHALLKGLKAYGYDESITIEREISGDEQIADIKEAKINLKNIISR